MGFFDWAFGRNNILPNAPTTIGGSLFYPFSAPNVFKSRKFFEAYSDIPEIGAVINKRAKEFARAKYSVVNDKGEVQHDHWLQKLIENPNWFQAEKEFLMQTKLFHDISGNEFIYNLTPLGLSKPDRTSNLFTLPPQLMEVCYKSTTPFFLNAETPEIEYKYHSTGGDKLLETENIIHLNDNRVNVKEVNDKSVLLGESKMERLKPAINNLYLAYESRGVILKSRGADGLISSDSADVAGTIALDDDEKLALQNRYKAKYGTLTDQHQIIITNAKVKYTPMGVKDPSKLGLFEETEADFNKILDVYDTPPELFVTSKGSTYENQNTARKGFIMDTMWPETIEWCGALNRKYLQNEKVKLISDYTHLHLFQEDLKMRGDAMTSMINALSKAVQDGALTLEEYQTELLNKFGLGKQKQN